MSSFAKEILAVTKEIVAIEFKTQDALEKYLKDHPAADKSKHKVKETQKEGPVKEEAPAEKGEGEEDKGEKAPAKKEAPAKQKPGRMESLATNYISKRREIFQKDSGISHDEYLPIEKKLDDLVNKDQDTYDKFEPLSDSVWKGYFKTGEDELLAAAKGLVDEGHLTKEEVGHVLNRGLSEAKADVESWDSGNNLFGMKKDHPSYDQYAERAKNHLKDWTSLIKKFKGGEGKAPAEKAPEGEKAPAKPEAEAPAKKPSVRKAPAKGQSSTSFDRFDINMTPEQADSITQPGQDAMAAVKELMKDPDIKEQLDSLSPDDIRKELSEYGAWDDEELADDEANKKRILWIAGGNIKEEPEESEGAEEGGHPDLPLKNHAKAKVNTKTLAKVQKVMGAHRLKGEEDELQELAGFKKTLGQRVPEKDVGKYYVRNAMKLKKDFLANMDPSNYKNAEAFANAKQRMQKMPPEDFAKILAAINDEEEVAA